MEVLLVSTKGKILHLSSIKTVFPSRLACRSDHGQACGRVETEVVPHIAQGHRALVGPSFREDTHRRIAGAVKGQHTNHVVGATLYFRCGQQNGLDLYFSESIDVTYNDFSYNNNWPVHLIESSYNFIDHNNASHGIRYGPGCSEGGCDSAGMLIEEHSNGNIITHNDLTVGGDGFFLRANNRHCSNNNYIAFNDGSWSLARNLDAEGREFLFDHSVDPLEDANLLELEPAATERMRAALHSHLAVGARPGTRATDVRIDPSIAERLRAMGYLQ